MNEWNGQTGSSAESEREEIQQVLMISVIINFGGENVMWIVREKISADAFELYCIVLKYLYSALNSHGKQRCFWFD